MSIHYFNTSERIAALQQAAASWDGTPFAPSSAVKGRDGGVCCHRLAIGVVADAGFPVTQVEIPDGVLNRATHHAGSIIADWLRLHPDRFQEIAEPSSDKVLPGDILLIKLGLGAHHAGVVIDAHRMIHSWQQQGAHIIRYDTGKFSERVAHIFRPISHE